jgi:hypothetical protein
MYYPGWKNITTSLNEFMKKRIVPYGDPDSSVFVFNMPSNSVELVSNRV